MAEQTFKIEFEGYWRERNINGIPSHSGVYCVYECTYNANNDTVTIHRLIYIGESGNVNERIANHEKWSEWKRYVKSGNELCFSFAYVESSNRDRVEAALIFKHNPPANDEYKDSFPFDRTTISASGKTALLSTYFTVERTP
ncbi:GIY-YIG nuclease family protein [bacterium]|nr:GIY-YIG nuclease family protein [bacterium]